MTRITSLLSAGVVCTSVLMIALCWDGTPQRDSTHAKRAVTAQLMNPAVAAVPDAASESASESRNDYPVIVNRPSGPPLIELSGVDPQGRSGKVACSTCHSVREPNRENRTAATLDEFHQGFKFHHGTVACYSCHNPEQSDTLRLADETIVQYRDVKQLCSQCHAAQAKAFAHGAHGGMNGYWDLTRGPQTKNNCVDCHDPHAPSYPKMIVTFKPRDRFLEAKPTHDDHK